MHWTYHHVPELLWCFSKRYPWQSYPCMNSFSGHISWESCVHSLLIFHQIPPCTSWYTKTQLPWTSNNYELPVVTRLLHCHAEVKDQMPLPQPHDAAASMQCHGGTLMSVTLKNHTTSKPQLWLLRAASRLCMRHCMVVKNQGLIMFCFL